MIKKITVIFLTGTMMSLLTSGTLLPSPDHATISVPNDLVSVSNGKIEIGFEKNQGKLVLFKDLISGREWIDPAVVKGFPWEINFYGSPAGKAESSVAAPSTFSVAKRGPRTLLLKWGDFAGAEDLKISAEITLDSEKALSYWKIAIEGLEGRILNEVVFPKVAGVKQPDSDEYLVIPTWTGSLMANPRKHLSRGRRKMEWSYPGELSSQVIALYSENESGFYASCNDSLSYAKSFALKSDSLHTLVYEMINRSSIHPESDTYTPAYEAVIGTFQGDWIDVAEIYGEWALQQKWVKESRFKNGLTPSWIEETALWVWNRGKSDNVLRPAIELRERLGLPVNVLWHWWHHCSYDDNFPEYLPPREGREPFVKAVRSARDAGVHCHVYMNAIQWGDATTGWKSGEVAPYTVKNFNGNVLSHPYNIFSGNSLINMCVGTDFWRHYYASLCDSVINRYQADGVYMDQTCLSRLCYDKSHGHEIGGGNYWVTNSGKLIDQVRSNDYGDKQPIFTGEGSSENWLPFLDAFLTLQSSRERYAGMDGMETIPFFQAVYHPYGITYGSYSSLVTPPFDELWPGEFAPNNTEQPLPQIFHKQFLMEQARSFVWGMQPTIANYHTFLVTEKRAEIDYLSALVKLRYKALKYLLYGTFLRAPEMEVPEETIEISKLSIYVGRDGHRVSTFQKSVPLLYSGAWKADDGNVAIALASISDDCIPVKFQIETKNYALPESGKIYLLTNEGRELFDTYSAGIIQVDTSLPPEGLLIVEITP